ncbi:class F sortase [Candidatus Saccharibacteria bacterium]|nr:class F sortase [Candidatus Saccharibacteria bacterium]
MVVRFSRPVAAQKARPSAYLWIVLVFGSLGITAAYVYDVLVAQDTEAPKVVARQHPAVGPPPPEVPTETSEAPSPQEEAPQVVIPASTPLRVGVPKIGVNAEIEVYTPEMRAERGGYNPSTRDIVSWDATISPTGAPGTDSQNTVYLHGHSSWVDAVFNNLGDLANGDLALVTTENGTIYYSVVEQFSVQKVSSDGVVGFADHETVVEKVPGRLILVGCDRTAEDDAQRVSARNVVVVVLEIDLDTTAEMAARE